MSLELKRLAARPALDMLFKDVHDKASRNEQIHQAVRVHEYTLKEVADSSGLYYSTISVIVKRVAEEEKHQKRVVKTPHANLSRGMRHLNGVYTQRINRLNRRTGHVLQGRFKSILVEKDSYLLELARYVILNPVRAKMVRSAKDWRWSSYRATSGLADAPDFMTVEWILAQFDRDTSTAQRAYRKFVRQGRGVEIWDELRSGNLFCADSFADQVVPLLDKKRSEIDIPRFRRLAARPTLDELFADVHDKETRNERIHKAMRVHEYTLKELAEYLGLHYSTISVIAKKR